jgi:hypothetical protein
MLFFNKYPDFKPDEYCRNAIDAQIKLIDEEFEEVELSNGSCVEFKFVGDFWYILSSDGLKNS